MRKNKNKLFLQQIPSLIFDTETNGIPKKYEYNFVPYFVDDFGARLLQLSWIIVDQDYNIIKHQNYYIKSDAKNTPGAFNVNHITDEQREKEGLPFTEIYQKFVEDLKDCNTVISHGITFDIPMFLHEAHINNLDCTLFATKKTYCTKQLKKSRRFTLAQSVNEFDPNDYKILEGLKAHDSLYDCCLTLQLLKEHKVQLN